MDHVYTSNHKSLLDYYIYVFFPVYLIQEVPVCEFVGICLFDFLSIPKLLVGMSSKLVVAPGVCERMFSRLNYFSQPPGFKVGREEHKFSM